MNEEAAQFGEFLLALQERDVVSDSQVTNPKDPFDVIRNLRAARDLTDYER